MLSTKLNILIDKDGHARLADFGLLVIVSDSTLFTASSSIVARGTVQWMSPELFFPDQFDLKDSRPTKESDCYALGMVIYEVLSGQVPFASLNKFTIPQKLIDGERPGRPGGAEGVLFADDLWGMLGLCWATQPNSRPSIEVVYESLDQVSGTWKPLPPQANNGTDDESAWDPTITAGMILAVWFWSALLHDSVPIISPVPY
jgi:serine/threonine protein kinase